MSSYKQDKEFVDQVLDAINSNHYEQVKVMLKDFENIDVDDGIILHSAIESRNLDMVKIVVEHGANVDTIKADHSPLTLSLSNGDKDIANYLIEQGADVSYSQDTAMSYAIQDQDWDMVKNLAKHGADLTVERGMAFSQAACSAPDELPRLIQAAQEMNPSKQRHHDYLDKALVSTIIDGNNQAAKALMDLGADPTKNNDNAFYNAVRVGNQEMIKHLVIDRNMPISNDTKDYLKSQDQGKLDSPHTYALHQIGKRELNERLTEKSQQEPPSFSMDKPRQGLSKKMKSQGMKL